MSIHLCLLQQFKTRISVFFKKHISDLSPYWSALYFWQIDFEKSSWTNWIFCLFRTWFLLCSLKILVWNRQKFKFVQLDFSNQISKIKIRSIGGMSLFAHVSIPWDHCNVCGLQQREEHSFHLGCVWIAVVKLWVIIVHLLWDMIKIFLYPFFTHIDILCSLSFQVCLLMFACTFPPIPTGLHSKVNHASIRKQNVHPLSFLQLYQR